MATAADFTTLAANFTTAAAAVAADIAAAVAAIQALQAAHAAGVNPTDLDAPLASMSASLAALNTADTQLKAATPPPPAPAA